MTLDPRNPFHLLAGVTAAFPDAVAALPVSVPHDPDASLVLKAKTRTRRLPPDLAAKIARDAASDAGNGHDLQAPTHIEVGRLLLTVPADIAKNLAGPLDSRHVVYLMVVRRDVYDGIMEQATSRIVRATSMPAGPLIVKP